VKLSPGGQQSPIPGVNLGLGLPTQQIAGDAPAIIRWDQNGFKIWVVLSQGSKVYFAFEPIETAPGAVLIPAKKVTGADGLVTFIDDSATKKLQVVSRSGDDNDLAKPSLLIYGDTTKTASLRFTPDTSMEDGIVPFSVDPPIVLVKGTSIGLEFGTIAFDDSETAVVPDVGPLTLKIANDPTKAVTWRGIVCRDLKLYLPTSIPLFGGRAINMWFAVAFGGGINAVADTVVPPVVGTDGQEARPGFAVRIECVDPTAQGLAGLVPTLISATMDLPIRETPLNGAPIGFLGGKPVRARLTVSRDPVNAPGEMRLSLAFDAQGEEGLICVRTTESGPAHFFNVAAGMATSLIANAKFKNDGTMAELAAVGAAGSALFKPTSEFILKGVELESSGHGLPVGGELRFALDYTVALRVKKIGLEDFSVEMLDDQPMRLRIRGVALTYGAEGVKSFKLDYERAQMEIENPGAWKLDALEKLFDVLGSRTGRGSMWIEVDLRFKLNLGPIQISGMTLRASLSGNNDLSVSVTRMAAKLAIPGAIDGEGEVEVGKGGFSAHLAVSIVPINVVADALVIYAPPMILLGLGVDLPAPIPLANSGLGLFGIGGMFGVNARPKWGNEPDPILRQLAWEPKSQDNFDSASGGSTFGLSAVIGTLPDMGFSFSSRAGLLISVPDVMVRGALNARVLAPRVSINTPSTEAPPFGYSAFGLIGVDSETVSVAVIARGNFKPLLEVVAPFAAYFSRSDTSNWFVYLGADGRPGPEGRGIGPVSVKVLPDLLNVGADAYLMVRGSGITEWPYGRTVPGGPWTVKDCFIVAFGFSIHHTFGARRIAWAELNASMDLLLGVAPPTMAGFGTAGGSLHLGPFSAGVQASVTYKKQVQQEYLWAEVVARIELLFTDIEGKVTIGFGDPKAALVVDEPKPHPLDRLGDNNNVIGSTPVLTDDTYRVLAYLTESPADAPTVWPDIIVSVPFAVMPGVAAQPTPTAMSQFPDAATPPATSPKSVGTEMLSYTWMLNGLTLHDVTEAADAYLDTAKPVNGKLAASWQAPRSSAATVNELVLGSYGNALWVSRVADGGKSLDTDPLQAAADFCEIRVSPSSEWAVGARAWFAPLGTRVPSEFVSANSAQSLVQGNARHYATGNGTTLALDISAPLPPPYRLAPAAVEMWDSARMVHFNPPQSVEHEFSGHYWPPNLTTDASDPRYPSQIVDLTLDESVRDAQLLLLLPREAPSVEVWSDEFRMSWTIHFGDSARVKGPAGEPMFFALAEPTQKGTFVRSIHIRRPVPVLGGRQLASGAIGIVAVGGITRAADEYAASINAATAAKATALASQAAQVLQAQDKWEGEYRRTILDPGRLYRLDISLAWHGEVHAQQADGSRPVIAQKDGSRIRHFFFRTVKKAALPANNVALPNWAQEVTANPLTYAATKALLMHTRTDYFDAKLIERYFGDYTPAQSELFRFYNDPLSAHFTQDHVVALAKAYGFDLKLAVRRVDRPGQAYDKPVFLDMVYAPLANTSVLSDAQKRFVAAVDASPCLQPKPGRTGTSSGALEPSAWYELYVAAMEGSDEAGRLRGVTFRTSRWPDPEKMLSDVLTGKGTLQRPYLRGDLRVSEAKVNGLRGAPALDDDRAFEQATLALGADGWPACEDPRLSWMWVPAADDEAYRLVGVMIESPEPLERSGRVAIDQRVDLLMGRYSQSGALVLARRDRAGCRLLFIATQPITVRTWDFATRPALSLRRLQFMEFPQGPATGALNKSFETSGPHGFGLGQSLTRRILPALVFRAKAIGPAKNLEQIVALNVLPSFAEVAQ